jgi:signal transduction histidine kinase
LAWEVNVSPDLKVSADAGMLRQVLMNLVKNAIEANAQKLLIDVLEDCLHDKRVSLYIGNDGLPIPAENRQSLFVPFFTTKRTGSGIGLSLSRRMVIQQGGMLELADTPRQGCHVAFVLSLQTL